MLLNDVITGLDDMERGRGKERSVGTRRRQGSRLGEAWAEGEKRKVKGVKVWRSCRRREERL